MAVSGPLQVPRELGICRTHSCTGTVLNVKQHRKLQLVKTNLSSLTLRRDPCGIHLAERAYGPLCTIQHRHNIFRCYSLLGPSNSSQFCFMQNAAVALPRSYNALRTCPVVLKFASAVGVIVFAIWGLLPLMRQSRSIFLRKSDSSWKKSRTYYVTTSYLQPLLLWTGATLICRLLDPVVLPSEASQIVKQRLVNFTRSLSTVLAFAYCLSSVIQQAQKYFMETNNSNDPRNMGYQFAGKAVYSSVWVAAAALFMELLGFSTQKWLTAGGLGTVLLTLAGREIFTNFLSSVMIHATRPFIANEWIQTKIEGYEVSGTVEHVGWWSPTIIRGEDREAVHIPNHKFTVNVVRNLTQKTHWRIKTHLVISHLDVNKINTIVADMRKVLAKNPQVEHKRLHRRVFLENINPENQGLMILISCFVKTAHHEEYLCVKEGILLDLLRVISHHGARLATPIRTIQRIYDDPDLENVPFSDSIFTRGKGTTNRPLLLIEPPYKINGEERTKPQTRSTRTTGEQERKEAGGPVPGGQTDTVDVSKLSSDSKAKEATSSNSVEIQGPTPNAKVDAKNGEATVTSTPDRKLGEKGSEKPRPKSNAKQPRKTVAGSTQQNDGADKLVDNTNVTQPNQENERPTQPPTSRRAVEENIVLGVALEGSRRTLPIEDETSASSTDEPKDLATSRSGNGSSSSDQDKKDSQLPNIPSAKSSDQRDLQG